MKNNLKIIFMVFMIYTIYSLIFISEVDAGILSVAINAPAGGSIYNQGDTFTLTATASCTGSGTNCNGVSLSATLASGLSTPSTNPQSCANIARGSSCTRSWIVNTNSVGTKSITVTATSTNTPTASSGISVVVNALQVCGNNVKEGSEQCDGGALGGATCTSLGYLSGTLACNSDCTYDTSQCITSITNCGNDIIDSGEQCDGNALGGASCTSLGYQGGTLSCTSSCSYETGQCVGGAPLQTICGDNKCEGAEDCNSCSVDCGQCLEAQLNIVPQKPLNQDKIKRGPLDFYIKLFYGASVTTSAKVEATSSLFEKFELKENYPSRELMGKNIIILESAEPGEHAILITAEKSNAADEETIKVILDPNLTIKLSAIEKGYVKGERITFKGEVLDFSGLPQENLKLTMSLTNSGQAIFNKTILTDSSGKFQDSYLISFADPDGEWELSITSKDEYGNHGELKSLINIGTPEGVAYYAVNFLSPLKGISYKRGTNIPINVEVKEENKPVKDAVISFLSPLGETLYLEEIEDGVYSTTYKISSLDPAGSWRLAVQAIKTENNVTRAGGNSIPLYITSANLVLNLISPSKDTYYTGGRIKFEIAASYDDNTIVQGGNLKINFNNENLTLVEESPGIYSGEYLLLKKDIGTLNVNILASDTLENKGMQSIKLFIEERSLPELALVSLFEFILRPYWWAIVVMILVSFLIYKPVLELKFLQNKIIKAKESQELIKNMQIEAEKKYYKERSINKNEFNELMQDYETRLAKNIEDQRVYEKKLNGFTIQYRNYIERNLNNEIEFKEHKKIKHKIKKHKKVKHKK